MEAIVSSFLPVQRGLADLSHAQGLFERLGSSSEHVILTGADRLAILEFPNADVSGVRHTTIKTIPT